MGRKRIINKETQVLSTKLTIKESNTVRFISDMFGINIARFISMCIQKWISNHSDFIKMINKEGQA